MGVHDLGFRGYDGPRTAVRSRVTAILKSDVRRTFKNWKFILYYLFSISPAIMQLVVVYVWFVVVDMMEEVDRFPAAGGRAPSGRRSLISEMFGGATLEDAEFYFSIPLEFGWALTMLFSGVVGATMIARDRKSNALELYFSRGIRPHHYFLGKWGATTTLLWTQLVGPYVIVWLWVGMLGSMDGFLLDTGPMILRGVLAQTLFCATLGFLAVSQSVSSASTAFAVIRWTAVLFGLHLIASILAMILDNDSYYVLSPWHVLTRVFGELAGIESTTNSSLAICGLLLAGLVAFGVLRIWKSLRPVEVIG